MTTQPNTPAKRDLRAQFKHLYNPSAKTPEIIDTPTLHYLMIDGAGDPNTALAYKQAVEALYSVSYTLKFAIKKTQAVDYPVMPLEGLWWVEQLETFSYTDRSHWRWTMMIMQPDFITADQVDSARAEAGRKKDLPALPLMRFAPIEEGTVAQVMHIGAYADEPPTIDRLHTFIADQGCVMNGKHHEIYLNDPTRTAPDKLKTVIRYPVRRTHS